MPPGRYRSRGEAYIASALNRVGLTYQYEPRLVLPPAPEVASELLSASSQSSSRRGDVQSYWETDSLHYSTGQSYSPSNPSIELSMHYLGKPPPPNNIWSKKTSGGTSGGGRWVRPDFYLPQYRAVVEYAGRMDLADYRDRHLKKTQLYAYNRIDCHTVLPEDFRRPYWSSRLVEAIDATSSRTPNGGGPKTRYYSTLDERL